MSFLAAASAAAASGKSFRVRFEDLVVSHSIYHFLFFMTSPFAFSNSHLDAMCGSTTDMTHQEPMCQTPPDPFQQEQVFVPDSAELDSVESCANNAYNRRLSAPSMHEPLSLLKSDQLSLPGTLSLPETDDFSDIIPPISSLTSTSSSSLSSSTSSILNDPLLVDVTGSDVIGLLSLPKVESLETTNTLEIGNSDPITTKPVTFCGNGAVRRSPPPPNVTLNPEKHKRSMFPAGKTHAYCQNEL